MYSVILNTVSSVCHYSKSGIEDRLKTAISYSKSKYSCNKQKATSKMPGKGQVPFA